jgi:hypothetical protein
MNLYIFISEEEDGNHSNLCVFGINRLHALVNYLKHTDAEFPPNIHNILDLGKAEDFLKGDDGSYPEVSDLNALIPDDLYDKAKSING